jgi:hypothetical protein
LRKPTKALSLGLALLFLSLLFEQIGSRYQSLWVLVLSLSLGIAGSVVAFRGLLEFLGEVF